MKLLLMGDQDVGFAITNWLLTNFCEDVGLVITTSENHIWKATREMGVPCTVFDSAEQVCTFIDELDIEFDIGVLAWWPTIVKQPLLSKPRMGFINTHPSLLPYNRGKHYNFWAIVEQVPFGVSLHMVDDNIDAGDVVAQLAIPYDWLDNGETLYMKAKNAMVRLFQDTYPAIRKLDFPRKKQDLTKGSFHRGVELEVASQIDLDRTYRARDLLNLLRARTFTGYPSCWFIDGGELFEVRINITRKIS